VPDLRPNLFLKHALAKPATLVTTGSDGPNPDDNSKAATSVITGFLSSGAADFTRFL
jgi:hypothetical protein